MAKKPKAFQEFQDNLIDMGKLFYVLDADLSVSDGETRTLLIRTGLTPVHFIGTLVNASGGPIFANIYESPSVGSPTGDPVTVLNANRESGILPQAQVFENVEGSPKGLLIDTQRIPPQIAGSSGGTFAAGLSKTPSKIIMKPGTDYLIELLNDPTNAGTGTADIYSTISFYEDP